MKTEHSSHGLAGSSPVARDAGGHASGAKYGAAPGAAAQRLRTRLVYVCTFLVALASAAIMSTHFEFAPVAAGLGGGAVWAALMTLHQQIQKNQEISLLRAELAKFEHQRGAAPDESIAVAVPPQVSGGSATYARSKSSVRLDDPAPLRAPASANQRSPADAKNDARDIATPASGPQMHPRWEKPQPRPDQPRQATAAAKGVGSGPAMVETALWPGNVVSPTDPMRDPWAFRPKDGTAGLAVVRPDADYGEPQSALPSSLDSDLEMVQRKIKALADEVNAVELGRDRPSNAALMQGVGPAIEKSVGALKATAESMRDKPRAPVLRSSRSMAADPVASPAAADQPMQAQSMQSQSLQSQSLQSMPFEFLIPATAERIAVSMPETKTAPPAVAPPIAVKSEPDDLPDFEFAPPAPLPAPVAAVPAPAPLNPRLAAIAAAIENGAMDVFLSPIVALQTHQVSHYDVTVRLKGTNGSYIDGAEQELQLAGNDMLALFDTARLKRSAALAARLDAHNKPGSLLSPVNGPSLTNSEFLETFAHAFEERDRISNQLVLTFTQADVEMFSASAWQALSNMHAFGFRFALAQIDHLAMDFSGLAKRGFAFLRLEARALIDGLPARDRFVEPDELCKMLAGAGMTLVADTIDDDAIRARVFGFGILYGQGRLFGGTRQVKLDALPAGSSAAA
jgi:cyclic-di-GMP phosphodiesterase, flagellum assembly factor TipF